MTTTKLTHRITSVILSLLMLTSMLVLPETAGLSVQASAETLTQVQSGEHLTEVPEGYTAVRTIEDLYAIRSNPTGNFILMNDIDLSATAPGGEWDGGNGWTPIPKFSGTLDGNGFSLNNLYFYGELESACFITQITAENVNNAKIKNLSVNNMSVSGGIKNFGFIQSNEGYLFNVHIENASCEVSGSCGLIAADNCGKIERCSASGVLLLSALDESNNDVFIGGLVGRHHHYINSNDFGFSSRSTIVNSFSAVDITINENYNRIYVGGIAGESMYTKYFVTGGSVNAFPTIRNCYNNGLIMPCDNNVAGGLVGNNWAQIDCCVNLLDGRLYGNGNKTISTTQRTDQVISDYNYCKNNSTFGNDGTELTAPLMKQQASYLGFDFNNTWEMYQQRPRLKSNPEEYVVSINYSKTPNKLTFNQGDQIEPSGEIAVNYTDGTTKKVSITKLMLSGYDMSQIGDQTVTVTYRGFTLTYPIKVIEIPVQSIALDSTELNMHKEDIKLLSPTITPENATNKTITWTSSDGAVATVDETGKVTAVAPGKATITAATSNGKKATCAVTVIIPAENITLDKNYAQINKGETLTLKATTTPSDSTDNLTWASSDGNVATVDENGTITAKGAGTANITVTAESGVFASCFVEVTAPVNALTFSSQLVNMVVGDSDVLSLTVEPADSTEEIEWSADSNIISISMSDDRRTATIYANKKGTSTITAKTANGVSADCKVTVTNPSISAAKVELEYSSVNYDGYNKTPEVTVTYNGKTLSENVDYTVSYTNNKNIGTATVTVTGMGIYEGKKTASFTIREKPKTDISGSTVALSQYSYYYDGYSKKPSVTVTYDYTTLYENTDYTVSYSNNVNVGTATVTVKGIGDYTGTKTTTFTIENKPKTDLYFCTLSLSSTSYIYDGTSKKPTVTVKDGYTTLINGTDYTVSYSNNVNVGTATVTVNGIGNYTGTKMATFTIESASPTPAPTPTPTPSSTAFTWGSDNWNFLNSSTSGDFSSGTYRSQINQNYKDVLKDNLTSSEYQAIFVGSWFSGAWLDDNFKGCCYGMSSTTLLAKQGLLPYGDYKWGASKLHDLDRPTSNSNVSSLIVYYQMLQVKSATQQQYRTVPKRSHETNINQIISLLDSNETVLVGFQKEKWGGHAILAYGYEYGNWTKNGVSYGARIKICDPNSSSKNDENYYIYFNTRTYAWAIPAYSSVGITSAKGAVINYIGADINEINQGGYLSGNSANRSENFIARIDAFAVSENRSVSKVQTDGAGSYLTMNTAPGDIEEDYSYVLGNESEGTIGYNLRDGDAAYMITQGNPDELELAMTYENCSMIGGSKAGESVIFDKSGYVEVQGQSAEYAMSITMNDECPTDWFTVAVKGQGADNATLKQVENGWVVASDSLNNVEVTVNNKYDMAYTTFTTEYPAALIYEIDEDTIGIAVDKDNNGTYETTLDTKTSKSSTDDVTPSSDEPIGNLGDIDGDGEITANDALTILRSSVGMAELTPEQTKLADVDNDGEITANDALAVLRYSVGMADADSPINKPVAA